MKPHFYHHPRHRKPNGSPWWAILAAILLGIAAFTWLFVAVANQQSKATPTPNTQSK